MYLKKLTYLHILQNEDGKLYIDSNNFQYDNFDPSDIMPAVLPFVGMSDRIAIKIETGPPSVYKARGSAAAKAYEKQDIELRDRISQALRIQCYGFIFTKPKYKSFENVYANYRYLASNSNVELYSCKELEKVLKDKDVVFCGAGPSIENHLDTIKDIVDNNRAIVVAGGSGLRVLCKAGIKPHFAYVCDPFDSEWDNVFSYLCEDWAADISLISGIGLEPSCLKWWANNGGPIFINGGLDVIGLINYMDQLPAFSNGLAVSNGIIELCNLIGVNSLTYFGVDLCLNKDNKLYADGQELEVINNQIIEHNGYKTRQAWINEVDLLGIRAHQAKYPVYRVGKGGMPVPNIVERQSTIYLKFGLESTKLDRISNVGFFQSMLNKINIVLPQIETYDFNEDNRRTTIAYRLLFKPYEEVQFSNTLRGANYDFLLMNEAKKFHLEELNNLKKDINNGLETYKRKSDKDI